MVNLFGNTFNKKVVAKLVDENLKYTRAQYRDKLQLDLKHERPPMVPEKEWKALIEDAKEKLLKTKKKKLNEHISLKTGYVLYLSFPGRGCFPYLFSKFL